jgi:hypothetical protein
VFADWLEENGDPARAEFVRVQCRLAERLRREAVATDDPDRRREYQLESQLGERWLAEVPALRGVRWSGFWRGFPAVSVTTATTLVRAAAKIWDAAPVEAVTITGLNANGARVLAAAPVFEHIRVLTLDRYFTRHEGERPLRTLFHSYHAKGLRRLNLTHGIGEKGIVAIVESPHLTGLEWLSVGAVEMTDAAAETLLTAPALRNLRGGLFTSYHLSDPVRKRLRKQFPAAVV